MISANEMRYRMTRTGILHAHSEAIANGFREDIQKLWDKPVIGLNFVRKGYYFEADMPQEDVQACLKTVSDFWQTAGYQFKVDDGRDDNHKKITISW